MFKIQFFSKILTIHLLFYHMLPFPDFIVFSYISLAILYILHYAYFLNVFLIFSIISLICFCNDINVQLYIFKFCGSSVLGHTTKYPRSHGVNKNCKLTLFISITSYYYFYIGKELGSGRAYCPSHLSRSFFVYFILLILSNSFYNFI